MLATNDWLENTGKFSIKLEQIDNCRGWLQFFVCNPWRILAEGGAPTPGQPSFIIRPSSALPGHYLRVILPGPRRYITRYTCLRCNLARPGRWSIKVAKFRFKIPIIRAQCSLLHSNRRNYPAWARSVTLDRSEDTSQVMIRHQDQNFQGPPLTSQKVKELQ